MTDSEFPKTELVGAWLRDPFQGELADVVSTNSAGSLQDESNQLDSVDDPIVDRSDETQTPQGATILGSLMLWKCFTAIFPSIFFLPFWGLYLVGCWEDEVARIASIAIPPFGLWLVLGYPKQVEGDWNKQFVACNSITCGLLMSVLGACFLSLPIFIWGSFIAFWGWFIGNRETNSYWSSIGLFASVSLALPGPIDLLPGVVHALQSISSWSISAMLDWFEFLHVYDSNLFEFGSMSYSVKERLYGFDGLLSLMLLASVGSQLLGRPFVRSLLVILSAPIWIYLGYCIHALAYVSTITLSGNGTENPFLSMLIGAILFGIQIGALYWTDVQLQYLFAPLPYDSYLSNHLVRPLNRFFRWPSSKGNSVELGSELESVQIVACNRNLKLMTGVASAMIGLYAMVLVFEFEKGKGDSDRPIAIELVDQSKLRTSKIEFEAEASNSINTPSTKSKSWSHVTPEYKERVTVRSGHDDSVLWNPRSEQANPIAKDSLHSTFAKIDAGGDWRWYFEERVGTTDLHLYLFQSGLDSDQKSMTRADKSGFGFQISERLKRNLISAGMACLDPPERKAVIEYSIETDSTMDLEQLERAKNRFLDIRTQLKDGLKTSANPTL